MKYYNSDIVFQEIPDETTLAVNICGCPNRCEGCHSKWLWKDEGMMLFDPCAEADERFRGMDELVGKYARNITCVCFMGGDQSAESVELMAIRVKQLWPGLKTAWYSGRKAPLWIEAQSELDNSDACGASSENDKAALYEAVQEAVGSIRISNFDYIKLGPYIASLGGLRSPSTNQRIYRLNKGEAERIKLLNPHDRWKNL